MDEVLIRRLEGCQSLPTLPAVAIELVALCQDPDADLGEIGRTLSRDQALTARLLRVANSVSVAARGKITTVSRAVPLLGTNTVLTLALGFTLVRARRASDASGFDHARHWRRALRCALAARVLAEQEGLEPEELFLAGLLQDLGALALHEIAPAEYGPVVAAAGGDHARLAALERERFGADHAEVTAWLARRWRLPPLLELAAQGSHDPARAGAADPDLARAVSVVHRSGALADVWETPAPGDAALEAARAAAGVDGETFTALLGEMAARFPEVAADFDVALGDREAADGVLDRAREMLVQVGLRAADTARAAEAQAEALASEKRELEERSTRDALTGLLNRAHLDAALPEAFARARARGAPLAVMLCDLDHFKRVNDLFGHLAGDAVLRAAARAIGGAVRGADWAARYGGEEFVVVLPDTALAGARAVAERIRAALAALVHPVAAGTFHRVTGSLGLAVLEPSAPFATPAALLAAADAALYRAKRAGRDRVAVHGE
jgi:diguanylate cyclase (GGDEF)-like protein